jgi:metal-responsive CopG/Arc/MetJ family transcriptional regulator
MSNDTTDTRPAQSYTLSLKPALVDQVDELAAADERSRSFMVAKLIRLGIETMERAPSPATPSPEKAPE